MLSLALLAAPFVATQFVFEGPPKLRLELTQIGRATGGHVRMRVTLVNRGGRVWIDPAMIQSDLTEIVFADARTGRRIVPKVGGRRGAAPLRPKETLALDMEFRYGCEAAFVLPRDAAGLQALARTSYSKGKGEGRVWEGSLRSNPVRLVGSPSVRKRARR